MAKPRIEFPKPLKELLENSDLQAPIRALADRVGEILAANQMPFFPDYTDHGIEHVNRVLEWEVKLVPKKVFDDSKEDSDPRLLCDADAAVIIGATLLHDLAMFLQPKGFLELVSEKPRFRPLPWFDEDHEGHAADLPWPELWADYVREARRFSDRQLTDIIGEDSAQDWKFDKLPESDSQWERNHFLIIGEFVRRHHARLAHEIAIYGFPGLPLGGGEGEFPAMGSGKGHPLKDLADLIGLTARSHGMSLRVCQAYLEWSPSHSGTPQPLGTAVLYPMALLRVADYLQIDRQRAPAVLLQLRDPQSPISVQEWAKHQAVRKITSAKDPCAIMVTVSTDVSLPTYLQLEELLAGLQAEMDHSTAVLGEVYGKETRLGLDRLELDIRRVNSNLHPPAFRDNLPYVPKKTGFTADPHLLPLIVEPLYGKHPSVGIRELMQNAADAVRELEVWCEHHKEDVNSLELQEQEGDVVVDFIKRPDETWFLRVCDRGIGMTAETIQNYFLRAGASFRYSAEWSKEFVDETGKPCVARAGRFGIGAFAVFLLGASFKLSTRHAGAAKDRGYTLDVSGNSQLIEIRRDKNLFVGTTVEVELSGESIESLQLEKHEYSAYEGPGAQVDWFCWDWPKVVKRVIRGPKPEELAQEWVWSFRKAPKPSEWSVIHPVGFEAVFWTFGDQPALSCNGLIVKEPKALGSSNIPWPEQTQLQPPCIAVVDTAANLPLTIRRYELSQVNLPFAEDLAQDALLSFIAHALVCGPSSPEESILTKRIHPLKTSSSQVSFVSSPFKGFCAAGWLRWCTMLAGMVPADPWLYTLLNPTSCIIFGALHSFRQPVLGELPSAILCCRHLLGSHRAILPFFAVSNLTHQKNGSVRDIFEVIAREGAPFLGPMVGSGVLFSEEPDSRCSPDPKKWKQLYRPRSPRPSFGALTGTISQAAYLEPLLEAAETDFKDGHSYYAAEIKTMPMSSPDSMIAKIWHECLGPNFIPFDPASRKALIDHGSKNPGLKRHIDAWQKMKANGSKWVTGEERRP